MGVIRLPASYYQQFDANFHLDVPAEGYGGWQRAEIELAPEHTALVVMHAWHTGTREAYPGWHRAVEYIPRADAIARDVFPALLTAVRASSLSLFHVVGGGSYYKTQPGYLHAVELAAPPPLAPAQIDADPVLERLHHFRAEHVSPGAHNRDDGRRGKQQLDFANNAEPAAEEGIAEDSHQLFALCQAAGINHLIYAGFAVNWCLLMSPGGMLDMSRRGFMCSTLRQAVTAVENKETARGELAKELALWRVALAFGFVFDVPDFIAALRANSHPTECDTD